MIDYLFYEDVIHTKKIYHNSFKHVVLLVHLEYDLISKYIIYI